jgi:predicted nucleic acid-binding protein
MREQPVYLDSSAIAKRYVREKGSDLVDKAYRRSEIGELRLAFSIWNIGEVLGVLDRYHVRKLISEKEFSSARSDLVSETLKLSRLGSLDLLPVTSGLISQSWEFVTKHHIYEADALQISSGKTVGCALFLGADGRLLDAVSAEGMKPINVETMQLEDFY